MKNISKLRHLSLLLALFLPICAVAADLPGSKDPSGIRRYEGSEIIGYHAPRFDEFVLPLGPPVDISAPTYAKSLNVSGQISRCTYMAPMGRSPAEVFHNYETEFQRLDLETLYEKNAGEHGWFGPTLDKIAVDDGIKQILAYNEADEHVIVGKSKDAQPTYYYVFVTSYRDGVKPDRLESVLKPGRVLMELVVIAPQQMEQKMVLVSAAEMSRSLADTGHIALYGVYFDTDQDAVRADSQKTLQEIAQLLKSQPALRLHIVGHTDNQGTDAHNLDLSRRRAASVVRDLSGKYGIAGTRLDSFGAGWYAPVASNDSEDGRAKNRRVELVRW
jgi:OOP family OmpA-OmpF porin